MRTEEPNVQAVMVVGVKRAFVEDRGAVPEAERSPSTINLHLAAARTATARVVYLQNDETSGTGDGRGTDGSEHALARGAGELVIRTATDGGFCGTLLEAVLRERDERSTTFLIPVHSFFFFLADGTWRLIITTAALFALGSAFVTRTRFGHALFALGDSERATPLIGYRVKRAQVGLHVLSGTILTGGSCL